MEKPLSREVPPPKMKKFSEKSITVGDGRKDNFYVSFAEPFLSFALFASKKAKTQQRGENFDAGSLESSLSFHTLEHDLNAARGSS